MKTKYASFGWDDECDPKEPDKKWITIGTVSEDGGLEDEYCIVVCRNFDLVQKNLPSIIKEREQRAQHIVDALNAYNSEFATTVPTYQPEIGHAPPNVNVKIAVNQGITVTLPREKSEDHIDVYIERLPDRWTINVSPDGDDIRAIVAVQDNGTVTVNDVDNERKSEDHL